MFNLVDAVGRTPVTLSVKQRIAEGLSHAGTSNTLKVVSYNCILGIMGGIGSGAVRQFCWFAIVVLVAHWFLAHTFFITVLSIDIQRLELDELLRRDTSSAPSLVRHDSNTSKQPRSGWAKLGHVLKRLLKGRATTNVSLLLLLAITATLYYTTYSTNVNGPQTKPFLRAVTRNHLNTPNEFENLSPDWQLWKTLTPEKPETNVLHIRVEQPLVVTLIHEHSPSQNNRTHRTQSWAAFRLAVWLLKIMVLPIAVTTGLLWLLLLYLLKDAELLEAQQHHVDSDPSEEESVKSLQGHVSFSTLPRAFSSDVELIASSRDGQVIVSVGLRNEITVWNQATRTHMSIDATNLLLRTATSSHANLTLSSVAVEENGEYFAVGTGSGVVAVWKIDTTSIRSLIHLSLENSSAGVTDLQFGKPLPRLKLDYSAPPHLQSNLPNSEFEDLVVLLATFENGIAAKWTINEFATLSYVKPTQNSIISNVFLVRVAPENQILVAFAFDDGSLELVETGDTLPIILPNYHIRPGTQSDLVSHVHACRSELNGTKRLVVATATESGIVSLWDGCTSECISVLEDAAGRVTHLRISPIQCETCHYCGQLPLESISIAFSIDYVVRFFMLYLQDQTRRCSCTRKQLKHASSSDHLGRRSRSDSGTSSLMGSPRIPRARLATAFETPAFPVSGHGVHQRRVSEKEPGRRSSELLNISPSNEDHDGGFHLLPPLDGTSTPMQSPVSFWRNAIAILVREITCERGEWDAWGGEYVGIRRRPRSQGKTRSEMKASVRFHNSVLGLTGATMERWEVWTFDPVLAQMRSSVLVALALKPPEASSCAFAGFGNTIGVLHYSNNL
ncbi:hypothetical protein Agabi119p4_3894 [Agaricus bisporus var. burnettii]|uniref:Sterol regulatory element-binding protein cleavage-activating protein n=1 Tax=Agaricus bisporus var. burnettii TaxID=192524 RepID=A0A8H7F5L2_AGABI|nr:hypothetical protein Agabi119p4_3894 [Agaricus bisporus var. burnettii]